MRVLVVEDEELLAQAIAQGLMRETMAVDIAVDGEEALDMISYTPYDVVVLDRDLPKVHGDEVCRHVVKEHPETKVLMLTAARSLDSRVGGLELGADDYLTKPFEFPELVARIRSLARRCSSTHAPVLERAGVRLDSFRLQVFRGATEIKLTPKEFAVLQLLMEADGGVLSAEYILDKAWDAQADPFSNSIRVTIFHIRKKLGQPAVIHTKAGQGYYFGQA